MKLIHNSFHTSLSIKFYRDYAIRIAVSPAAVVAATFFGIARSIFLSPRHLFSAAATPFFSSAKGPKHVLEKFNSKRRSPKLVARINALI